MNDHRPAEYKWNKNDTKMLIDLYGKHKDRVGTLEIKNLKTLWQKIANDLEKMNIHASANNCLNRWRVLERNYKKFLDNKNKTGRGRKYFEYVGEMDELFGHKKNVHPEVLLDSTTLDHSYQQIHETKKDHAREGNPQQSEINRQNSRTPVKVSKTKVIRIKTSLMEKLRMDRKAYYDQRLKIEQQKLEELKKPNQLIEERNEIFKENKCICRCNEVM